MRDFTKRTIDGEVLPLEEQQPGPKKPNMEVGPFSSSAFQPAGQPSRKMGLTGIAEASSSAGKEHPQLANFNKTAAQDNNIDMNIENPNHDDLVAEKINPVINGGDDNAARTDEPQSGSGSNTQSEMDEKRLKRMIANRASAQRSRMRKNKYLADLEEQVKSYQNKISLLHPEIEAYKNRQRLLQIEHHQLKLQMAAREKERILQEVEIEKNKAEVNRLSELQRKLIVEARAKMQNMGAAMQLMSNNSNLDPSSGFGRSISLNSNQAQNGVGTSRLQTATSQEPENQSQMWMGRWNNGQRSTPNLNIVKSEPAD